MIRPNSQYLYPSRIKDVHIVELPKWIGQNIELLHSILRYLNKSNNYYSEETFKTCNGIQLMTKNFLLLIPIS